MIPSTLLTTILIHNYLACLEEVLKYVLLLNFDEEPKYDYIIEEYKKAYIYSMNELGEKPSINCFK
jgi:hypothetical protein